MSQENGQIEGLRPEKEITGLPEGRAILRMAAGEPALVVVEGQGRVSNWRLLDRGETWEAVEFKREVLVQG